MSQSAVAAFLRDPVTVSRKELIEHYRAQTARYKELAERQNRSSIHEVLVKLARQCAAMADALGSPKADQRRKLTEAEVLILFNEVTGGRKSETSVLAEKSKTSVPGEVHLRARRRQPGRRSGVAG